MSRNNSKFNTQNSKLTKRIFLSPPHMSGEEMRFVQEAFDSNYIAPVGPMVDAFEQEFAEYVGIKHCLALSSGTAAMHLALRCLLCKQHGAWSMEPGETPIVLASTLTFIGSVTPVVFEGATPVFIDCDRISWNMDPDLLAQELAACERCGKMPRAVIPTDLYGQCCDLPRIVEICDGYGVPVVCDSAEACGAQYLTQRRKDAKIQREYKKSFLGELGGFARESFLHAGVGAKAAVYSFNGNKIITTSGGGMLASDDKGLIDHARKLSQQARENFPHYEHEEIGYNYRMSNVLAAIGRGQLKVLDERVKKKREIFDYYQKALGDLPGIEFMPEPEWSRSNRWLTVILITPEEFGADPSTIFRTYGAGREAVRLALEAENIEARPVWKPMHLQPVFRVVAQSRKLKAQSKAQNTYEVKVVGGTSRGQKKTEVGDQKSEVRRKTHTRQEQLGGTSRGQEGKQRFQARMVGGKVSEDLFDRGLCLPSGTAMTEEDLDRVVEVIRNCRKK